MTEDKKKKNEKKYNKLLKKFDKQYNSWMSRIRKFPSLNLEDQGK